MRMAFRLSYVTCLASGHIAAGLAAEYRGLARASQRWGLLAVVLQLLLLIVWCPARALSVGSFALCQALVPRL